MTNGGTFNDSAAPDPSATQPRTAPPGSTTAAVAMGVMTVATYVYVIIVARLVGPQVYGSFASIMNVLLIVNVAALGLQATAARRVAAAPDNRHEVEAAIMRVSRRAALALTGVLLLLSPVLYGALQLDSFAKAVLIAACAFPLTLVGGQIGMLQGERRWYRLAAVYVAGGVPRLVIGTALLLVSPTEAAALTGVFLGLWAPVLVGWRVSRRPEDEVVGEQSGTGALGIVRESVHNVQALFAFLALSNVDVIVARNVLADHQAGLYAAGLILARAMLVVSQTLAVVVFPDLATPELRRRALVWGLVLISACGAAGTLGTIVVPDLAIAFVGGSQYAEIRAHLWQFALLGTVVAMTQFLVYAVLAARAGRTVLLVWAALVALIVVGLTATSVLGLLRIVTLVNVALLLALVVAAALSARRSTTRSV